MIDCPHQIVSVDWLTHFLLHRARWRWCITRGSRCWRCDQPAAARPQGGQNHQCPKGQWLILRSHNSITPMSHLALCCSLCPLPNVQISCQKGKVTHLKQASVWSCVTVLPHESRTLTTELSLPPWCQHKTGGFVLRMDWFHSLWLVAVAQPWQLFHCYDSIPLLRP